MQELDPTKPESCQKTLSPLFWNLDDALKYIEKGVQKKYHCADNTDIREFYELFTLHRTFVDEYNSTSRTDTLIEVGFDPGYGKVYLVFVSSVYPKDNRRFEETRMDTLIYDQFHKRWGVIMSRVKTRNSPIPVDIHMWSGNSCFPLKEEDN